MNVPGIDIAGLFSLSTLFAMILGTFIGLLIGTLPGLGATVAIVLLLPLTYSMSPLASILLLVAAYQGAEYGGSISSIVIGVPGTPAATATVLDGNALAKKSYPGKALGYSLTASTVGGLVGGVVLLFLSVPLARLGVRFADPEFFLIALLGLMAVAGLSSKDITKSIISILLGLAIGTVGMDVFTGVPRFTMGRLELMEGITMVALLVGMFAFSEVISMISEDLHKRYVTNAKELKTRISFKEFKGVFRSTMVGSAIGSIVGILPGMGAGPASWFAYSEAKRSSKHPERFGTGEPDGIAAPEAANNATVGGALVPLLALGIPGSPSTAIILGAFIIHGIQPGPKIFTEETELLSGILYGFLVATILMYILGKLVTPMFSKAMTLPNPILIPIVLLLSVIGVFAAKGLFFDLWIALFIGVASFFLKKLDFSLPAFILAFVLSPLIEQSLRRSLLLSEGSYSIFVTRPYSLVLMVLLALIVLFSIYKSMKRKGTSGDSNGITA